MSEQTAQHDGYAQGLNLTVSLCLTYTICVVLVRWWIRKGSFGIDDVVVLAATIVTLAHTAADYVALANGLGKPWGEISYTPAMARIQGASIASVILFWIALYVSKLAVLVFLCRITKTESQLRIYYTGIALTFAIGLTTVLVASVGCPSSEGFYWALYNNQGSCPSQASRWHVLTALDCATEVGLLVLPVHLVWKLQMPMRKKLMVLAAFWLRLPVIILSILREVYTTKLNRRDTEPSYGAALVVILMEIELTYALAANTLSALKAFTESFNSGFGQGFTRGKGSQYDMSGLSRETGNSSRTEKRKSGSVWKSLTSSKGAEANVRSISTSDRGQSPHSFMKLRPDIEGENQTRVSAEPSRAWRTENHSSGSASPADEMVIMRETELSIHHDQAPILDTVHR